MRYRYIEIKTQREALDRTSNLYLQKMFMVLELLMFYLYKLNCIYLPTKSRWSRPHTIATESPQFLLPLERSCFEPLSLPFFLLTSMSWLLHFLSILGAWLCFFFLFPLHDKTHTLWYHEQVKIWMRTQSKDTYM